MIKYNKFGQIQKYLSLYQEDAISVASAFQNKMAFHSVQSGNYIRGYLYKPGSSIKSVILIGFAEMSKEPGNPYDSFTLERTAAEKGYGPLLYDIMLSIADKKGSPVSPDRYSVSSFAKKVWQYYHDKRKDILYQPNQSLMIL